MLTWANKQRLRIAAVCGAVALLAKFTTDSDSINAWRCRLFCREPDIASKTMIVSQVDAMHHQPDSLRGIMLLELKVKLEADPRLVPISSRALLALVRDESKWTGDPRTCAGAPPIPTSLQTAVDMAIKRPAAVKWRFWTLKQRPPTADLRLDGVNLRGVNLEAADLRGFNLQNSCLHGAVMTHALMSGANLSNTNLDSARIISARLEHAKFVSARGVFTLFSKSHLEGAALDNAVLPHSSFRAAHLACATLEGTALDSADFPSAHIEWASFHQASLPNITNATLIDSVSVVGAFVGTARRLDPQLRQWLAGHGSADTHLSIAEWAPQRDKEWGPQGRCTASMAEP